MACWKLMHPDDIGTVQQAMARAVAEGEIVTVEYRWRHAGGDWEWVETTARCVGEEIQCSTRGIERAAAPRSAQQSVVARLGNLVDAAPRRSRRCSTRQVKAVAETLDVERRAASLERRGGAARAGGHRASLHRPPRGADGRR